MTRAGNRVARLWLPLVSALDFKVIPFDSLSHPPMLPRSNWQTRALEYTVRGS
jgi:hypothetical protein